MNKEELEILKDFIHNEDTLYCYDWQGFDHKTILPLIEKALNYISKLQKENEIKDKVIDLMAENIASTDSDLCAYIDMTTKNNECKDTKHCKDCIKQYFYKKAEEENE